VCALPSDKPYERAAYAMRLRVADADSVLDAMRVRRAHIVGMSYGGRLCFGIGEHARDRVLSLVIGGQQPYRRRGAAIPAGKDERSRDEIAGRSWWVQPAGAVEDHHNRRCHPNLHPCAGGLSGRYELVQRALRGLGVAEDGQCRDLRHHDRHNGLEDPPGECAVAVLPSYLVGEHQRHQHR
jgi:pimeloyl-ACP methyl ester carboxylesterase